MSRQPNRTIYGVLAVLIVLFLFLAVHLDFSFKIIHKDRIEFYGLYPLRSGMDMRLRWVRDHMTLVDIESRTDYWCDHFQVIEKMTTYYKRPLRPEDLK